MSVTASTPKFLDSLPDTIHLNILSYLRVSEWENVSKVNSLYKKLSAHDLLWKPIAVPTIQIFLKVEDPQLIRVFCSNWKETQELSWEITNALWKQEAVRITNTPLEGLYITESLKFSWESAYALMKKKLERKDR
jgi:F-box-like